MVGLWVVIFFFILYFQIFHTSQRMSFYNQIKINIISMSKEVGDSESKAKWNTSLPIRFFSPLCHHVLSLCYLSEPLPLLMLCYVTYWVGQKIRLGFSIQRYKKAWTNFLANPIHGMWPPPAFPTGTFCARPGWPWPLHRLGTFICSLWWGTPGKHEARGR